MNLTIAVPLLAIVLAAAAIDCATKRIPNGLSLGGAVAGLLIQTVIAGLDGFLFGVVGWFVCFLVFLPFYIGGGMAAGDVKLMAAAGAFLGPVNGLIATLLVMVSGALVAILVTGARAVSEKTLLHGRRSAEAPGRVTVAEPRSVGNAINAIPYAGAIALGTAAVVLKPLLF